MRNQYLYEEIYVNLLKKIQDEALKEGDKLPTEKELADQYNVSRITSKKALNMLSDKGFIVRKPGLGSFVTQQSDFSNEKRIKKIIGLVMDDFSSSYGIDLLRAVEDRITELGWFLCVIRSLGEQHREEEAIERLLDLEVDGIIIMPTHGEYYNSQILRLVVEGFPVVFMDRVLKGIPGSSAGTDNAAATEMMMKYLFDKNHIHVGLFTSSPESANTLKSRFAAYISAHQKNNVSVSNEYILDTLESNLAGSRLDRYIKQDKAKIKQYLEMNKEVTAIFTTEYELAKLLVEVANECDLSVPQDLSIVCFDSPDYMSDDYFFTHVSQNERAIGAATVDILIELISDGESVPTKQVLIDAKIVEGKSVRTL